MKWRIFVELAGADGSVQSHEISDVGGGTIDSSAETLGLTLAEGKKTLAGLQRHLVQAQTEEHCRNRRRCQRCGAQRPLKDIRRRRLTSLFGVVEVRSLSLVTKVRPRRNLRTQDTKVRSLGEANSSAVVTPGKSSTPL